nr:putative amino acid adenylation domain protein [Burkholderia pseudomallei]
MLYAALSGCARHRNHRPRCAADSGSTPSASGAYDALPARCGACAGAAAATRCAYGARIGASNSARTGTSRASRSATRVATRTAASEWPPSSKK